MVNLKMELMYCVISLSLLSLTSEASFIADNVSGFTPILSYNTPPVYGQTNTGKSAETSSISFTSLEYDTETTKQPASSIVTNDMRIERVVKNDFLPNERFATLDDGPRVANRIENVFRNIFENDTNSSICYFGAVFQMNEQYYEFEINPRGNVVISIGFGYAWNNVKLKGWTAEFGVDRTTNVLLSKNDKEDNIEVAIQSGSESVVLTSQKDRQYRPVVCLNGEVDSINVKLFNGMKMASIPSGTTAVDLPNSGKKLKPIKELDSSKYAEFNLDISTGLHALGLIEIHTLTSTTPPTYLFTGYFYDGSNMRMSPSVVGEEHNWGEVEVTVSFYSYTLTNTLRLYILPNELLGPFMGVKTTNRNWERSVYALYNSSGDVTTKADGITSGTTIYYCSGPDGTCPGSTNECFWPRSDRENLRPGRCIKKVCKFIMEAGFQTGLYKADGERLIGDEPAMRLIRPSDVGVKEYGLPMIKALLEKAEEFDDIKPTGNYEFGGPYKPREDCLERRYITGDNPFNGGNRYIDSDKPVCDTDGEFILIKSISGITVGLGIKVGKYVFIICQPYYGLVKNLVSNSLDPKRECALETYAMNLYQRVDPNWAIRQYQSQRDYNRNQWPEWPSTLPKQLTENLYYNNEDPYADHYYASHRAPCFNKDKYSAMTELSLGLSSAFKKCVDDVFYYDLPVHHVTTFVRQRMTNGIPIDDHYTEFHALLWNYGFDYNDIDFTIREMTPYDEYHIPNWFITKNGADPDSVEAVYYSSPYLKTDDDTPPDSWITEYNTNQENRGIKSKLGSTSNV